MKIPDSTATIDAQNPWLGLVSFTEENQKYFHGRDDEARELVRRLERKTLTVLFGQSGLGKSSLLQAGAIPRLRSAGFVPVYIRLDHGPAAPPLAEQIKPAVQAETKLTGTWSQAGSAVAGESLWEFFHHRDDVLRGGSGQQLTPVLVFDQFEELFTLGAADDATRARAAAFLAELADLVENRAPASFEARVDAGAVHAEAFDFARSDYRVLITLREDYLPHLEGLRPQMPSLMQNRMRLTRLTGAQALEAVLKPAPGLVPDDVAQSIVAFVSGRSDLAQAEVEPSLLSLVCRELNHRRLVAGGAQIDAALLAGSRETILTEFYERTLADQPAAVRHWVENELLTDSGYRENIALERAQKSLGAAGADPGAIDTLVSRRLLRIEERLDVRRIELTHDVLCAVVRASRDARREREAKEAAERELAAARTQEEATRRALRRAHLIAGACATLAVVAVASAIFGYVALRRARVAEAGAVHARQLADTARTHAEDLLSYLIDDLAPALEQYGRTPQLQQLVDKALAHFHALPAEARTLDTDRKEAKAWWIKAGVQSTLGDNEGERAALAETARLSARIVAAAPEDAEFQAYRLSVTLRQLWRDETLSQEATRAAYDKALGEIVALASRHRENLKVARLTAMMLTRYANFLAYRAGDYSRALAHAVHVESLWKEIIAREPANRFNRLWLGGALQLRGSIYLRLHENDKSVKVLQQAEDYIDEALKLDPGNLALIEGSAEAATSLSYIWATMDATRTREAELKARERYRQLTELDPTNLYYRRGFIWAHRMEGYYFQSNLQWAEARAVFRKFRRLTAEVPDWGLYGGQSIEVEKAEYGLLEASAAAKMGDMAGAGEILREVHSAIVRLNPDGSQQDPAQRKKSVRWQLRELWVVVEMRDWPEVGRRAEEILALVETGLRAAPADAELQLRRANAQWLQGTALLRSGRLAEAVKVLGSAVAGYANTPVLSADVDYNRAISTAEARAEWSEALIATGAPERARPVLEELLKQIDQGIATNGTALGRQSSSARLRVLLAQTLEAGKPDEAARRTELLNQAEAAYTLLEGGGHMDAEDRAMAAKIPELRAGTRK